jgi:O-antigen ligase/polysaccharide polymerase Wzy-like membrane protein
MELTVTGALFLPLVVIAMMRETILLASLAFFLGFSAFGVVNIPAATFGVQPYHFLGGVAVLTAMKTLSLSTYPRPRIGPAQPFFWAYFFVAAVIFSALLLAFQEKIPGRILVQSLLLIFGVCVAASIFVLVRDRESLNGAIKWYLRGGLFVAGWGVLQWMCAVLGVEYPSWAFNNSVSSAAELFDQFAVAGLPRISSVAIEPSYLGRYLGTVAAVMLVLDQSRQHRLLPFGWIKLSLVGTVLLLSTSSTAFLCIGLVSLYVFLTDVRQFVKYAALGIAGACFIIYLHPEFIEVISMMTIKKSQSGSYHERTASMIYGYKAFATAPFFGNGWGWIPEGEGVHDTLFKICSSLGVVGFCIFLLFVCTTIFSSWIAERATSETLLRPGAIDEPGGAHEMVPILRALRVGLGLAIIADFISGFSWVAANIWFMLGIVGASSRIAEDLLGRPGGQRREPGLEEVGAIMTEAPAPASNWSGGVPRS